MMLSNSTWHESAQQSPSAPSLATLATLGKVPPILDRLDRVFVKQSVKPGLHYPTKRLVKRRVLDSPLIVRIPPLPPVDEVLNRFGVLPLNNPPHFPRYNGDMEKASAISNRHWVSASSPPQWCRQKWRWPPKSPLMNSTSSAALSQGPHRLLDQTQAPNHFRLLL